MYKHHYKLGSLIFMILCFMTMCKSPTGPDILEPPTLLSPGNLAIFDTYPRTTTLTWSPVLNAEKYHLQIDYGWDCTATDSCLSWGVETDTYVYETHYTFNFVGAQPGRWRVRAIDSRNNPGRWSEYRYFEYLI